MTKAGTSSTGIPLRCVVDTNVATTANRANAGASAACIAHSARALQTIMQHGHVFIDQDGQIIAEYRRNLNAKGEPGPGDMFLKWILTNEWTGIRITRVSITRKAEDAEDFLELPSPPAGVYYDRSDRKFLAVSAAHGEHPSVLQSFDSKWWGWRHALEQVGIRIVFLCQDEIQQKHSSKLR
ncbi:MAG TPA: hypothetical protein DCQ33_01340 [Nitrospira sp.]|nr:hypothetical protein [Nitrospira sp.]